MLKPIPTRRPDLTADQRRTLLALLADRPGWTDGRIALAFERRTGRKVASSSVRRIRLSGYRSATSADPRRHLDEAERAILERLCHRAAPRYDRRAIAKAFEAEAGRPIHPTTVGRFLTRHFGDYRRTVAWT